MDFLNQVKHIFFDLDDTLWDFEANSKNVLQQLFDEFRLDKKLNTDFNTFHTGYKKVNAALWRAYYQKDLSKEDLRDQRFHTTFCDFGYSAFEESKTISEVYLSRSPQGKLLKPGCLEVLQYLHQKNYQLHIITNGFKEVQRLKLEAAGLTPYFNTVIISEEHGYTKPDTALFRIAELLTGSTANTNVMIGDNLESDIVGGKRAGWQTIHFNDTKTLFSNAGKSIRQLDELKGLL